MPSPIASLMSLRQWLPKSAGGGAQAPVEIEATEIPLLVRGRAATVSVNRYPKIGDRVQQRLSFVGSTPIDPNRTAKMPQANELKLMCANWVLPAFSIFRSLSRRERRRVPSLA
jgi:hypothetical protein